MNEDRQMEMLEGRGETGSDTTALAEQLRSLQAINTANKKLLEDFGNLMVGYEQQLDAHEDRLNKQGKRLEEIDAILAKKNTP